MKKMMLDEIRAKKRRKATIILSSIALIIVAFLMIVLLFRVKNVEITGNHHMTDEEVESRVMNGPLTGNTLYMMLFKRNPDFSDNAFIDHVNVEYVDRNSIHIRVTEKALVGYVEYDGSYWYFDKDGKILVNSSEPESGDGEDSSEEPDTAETYYIPLVKGLSVTSAAIGDVLNVSNPGVFTTLNSLIEVINKRNIDPDYVEFKEDGTMTMKVGNIFVLLGKDEHLEEKLEELSGILPKAEGLSGTLHLENFDGSQSRIIFDKDE